MTIVIDYCSMCVYGCVIKLGYYFTKKWENTEGKLSIYDQTGKLLQKWLNVASMYVCECVYYGLNG